MPKVKMVVDAIEDTARRKGRERKGAIERDYEGRKRILTLLAYLGITGTVFKAVASY